jgi:hypothetical protein
MNTINWVIAVLAFFVAGFFIVDGTVALSKGDYITPKSGEYAGQLGPWSKVVSAFGIEPRSNLMKSIFVIYGLLWTIVIVSYLLKISWAPTAMIIFAIGSLWYLPFGTLLGIIQIILLIIARLKS